MATAARVDIGALAGAKVMERKRDTGARMDALIRGANLDTSGR